MRNHHCHHHLTPELCLMPINGHRETWAWIPDWESYYLISDHGRVLSVDRQVLHRGGTRTVVGRIVKLDTNSCGYRRVTLHREGKQHRSTVHRLMATTFIGPVEGKVVRHLNDVKTDNRIENLAVGTYKDNAADALRNGRNHNARKTRCKRHHALVDGNVRVTKGGRRCVACTRAGARVRRHGGDRQTIADNYYLETIAVDITALANQLREQEVAKLDARLFAVWEAALAGDLDAVDAVIAIIDERAEMFGLYQS